MSTLAKVSAALTALGSDSKVAEALGNIVAAKRADSSEVLIAAVEQKLTMAKKVGIATSDGTDILKVASGLLSVASGTADVEYRVMTKAQFEDYAVEVITKAGTEGADARQIAALRLGIEVASVLFAGSDVAKSFAIPVAKEGEDDAAAAGDDTGDAASDGGDKKDDAAAAADGDGDGGDGGDKKDAAAADGDGDGGDKKDDDVEKSDPLPWPADMNTKEFMKGDKESDPDESFQ